MSHDELSTVTVPVAAVPAVPFDYYLTLEQGAEINSLIDDYETARVTVYEHLYGILEGWQAEAERTNLPGISGKDERLEKLAAMAGEFSDGKTGAIFLLFDCCNERARAEIGAAASARHADEC